MSNGFDGHKGITSISEVTDRLVFENTVGTITTTYLCYAPIGTPSGDAKWAIQRIIEDTSDGTTTIRWAKNDGSTVSSTSSLFVQLVAKRESLTYGA